MVILVIWLRMRIEPTPTTVISWRGPHSSTWH
jgi:hypothetical protein